jgi:hypothetical protein
MVIYAAEGYSGSEDGREARIGLEIEVVRRGLRPAGAVGMTRLAGPNLKPADARRLSSGGAYVAPERGRGGGHMDRRSSWDWVIGEQRRAAREDTMASPGLRTDTLSAGRSGRRRPPASGQTLPGR